MSLAFLLTSLLVVVSPGTGVLYTPAVALKGGARAASFQGSPEGLNPESIPPRIRMVL